METLWRLSSSEQQNNSRSLLTAFYNGLQPHFAWKKNLLIIWAYQQIALRAADISNPLIIIPFGLFHIEIWLTQRGTNLPKFYGHGLNRTRFRLFKNRWDIECIIRWGNSPTPSPSSLPKIKELSLVHQSSQNRIR